MNPAYHFKRMRELLDEHEPSRERSLAATKLDECEMWLDKCVITAEALGRDQDAPAPESARDALDAQSLHDSPGEGM
jgi:hypothetical protein